jgi:hypothetical protein
MYEILQKVPFSNEIESMYVLSETRTEYFSHGGRFKDFRTDEVLSML